MRRNLVLLTVAVSIVVLSSPARAEQLGVPIPAPLASTLTQGGAPNFADTFVTPFVATTAATILTWKTQFVGGYLDGTTTPGVPLGVQLKIFRHVPASTEVVVVAAGLVHDPRPALQTRFGASYPFFADVDSVLEFTDNLPMAAGDIVGLTYFADPAALGYFAHLVDVSPLDTRLVLRNVAIGGVIDLNDIYTGVLEHLAPALEIPTIPELSISIDIKPGSLPNSINLASAGSVPVAILSSSTFNATTVVPESVSLAGARVKLVGKSNRGLCAAEDVNGDGLLDLVCQVVTAQFIIEVGDSVAVLEADTIGGQHVRGQDSINIVP
jgi:hypothetical protein